MRAATFDRIAGQAATSVIGRFLRSACGGYSSAWNTSWAHRITAGTVARATAVGAERRVRLAALIVAWACGWHMLLLPIIPQYSASALPPMWTAAAGLVAIAVAIGAGPLTRAWHGSALRTILVQRRQKE